MKERIREITDRHKGISNEKREEMYQQFVRGWVEKSSQRNRPMGKTQNKGCILETMEETKNEIPNAESTKM